LIVPAYQQALAETLLSAKLPLRLYGTGWCELPRFRQNSAGPVTSREQLRRIAQEATTLIHAWPSGAAHPIGALGRPVVRRTGRRAESFVGKSRVALNGAPTATAAPALPSLSSSLRELVRLS
jgi:hypothetical protein